MGAYLNASPARVLGLDLSLTASGIATCTGAVHVIKAKTKGMARLAEIRAAVERELVPDIELAVIEGYSFGSKGSHLREIGELGGVVRMLLWDHCVPFLEVSPSTLKLYATGSGKAGKTEVVQAAEKRLGYDGHDDDEADALWLRAVGADLLGVPLCYLPETHRRALDALRREVPVADTVVVR